MNYKLAKQLPLIIALTLTGSLPAMAQDEPIYGQQLMTEQEREQHREKMRSLKTEQEREAYRREHHEKMQQRAGERGVTLPDEPGQRGKGMNQGKGKSQSQGKGKGMGSGKDSGKGIKNR